MQKSRTIFLVLFIYCLTSHRFVYGQARGLQVLQKQIEQVSTQGLTEKLYVHTDKDFYTAGEVIWFKVYAVDGIFNKPLDLSKVAYIEILDKGHKQVLDGKIPMNDGSGSGSFTVPASINSGNYLLRAYTSWMKNGGPDFFFEKQLAIVNSLKKPDWASQVSDDNFNVQFLPEGGQMVYGIESRVAIKAADRNGKGVNCSGYIINQKNDTVVSFKTLRFGMGRFSFLPVAGDQYKASLRLEDGSAASASLPTISSSGFVLKCDDRGKNIELTVNVNDASSNANVYLLVHTRQVAKTIEASKLTGGKTKFVIDKSILGDGISDIIIFNDQLMPVCERLYFKRPGSHLQINLDADKSDYDKRTRVNLQVATAGRENMPTAANLSVSVYLLDSVQSSTSVNIRSYLWLTSELKGYIENADYYFDSNDPDADEAADNLMMTQGWRRFNWNDLGQQRKYAPEFIPETDGAFARARIVNKRSGLPAAGVQAYLSVPGLQYFFTGAMSDGEGKVDLNINNLYGNNEVIIQPFNNGDSDNYRIDLDNPFSQKPSSTRVSDFSIPQTFVAQLQTHSLSSQVQNAFLRRDQQRYNMRSLIDSTSFYGKPDGKYFLDDYTRFTTMEEVIREYVGEAKMRKKDGEFHFMVKNVPYQAFFEFDPLILLDGVPVLKTPQMATFDPLKIRKLEVEARTFYTGTAPHYGIISYSSYDGDLAGFQLPSNAIVTEYPGYLYERSFYSPAYQTEQAKQSRLPDFRNVLEWNPSLKIDGTGKQSIEFYTSDIPGNYVIVAEGISKEGLCGAASKVISVK